MKVITSREMARLDSTSTVKAEVLMERAGKGMAEFIRDYMPEIPVIFLCGRGNNGGDGIVAASYLKKWGRPVEVYLISGKELKDLPVLKKEKYPGKIKTLDNAGELKFILTGRHITVDCMLGTGFTPPLRQNVRDILEIANKNSKIIVSCDISTGVDASTGVSDEVSIDADVTVTFEYPKIGHILAPGSNYSGSIELVKIGTGIKPEKYNHDYEMVVRGDCREYFKRRKKRTHKNDYGHVLIAGGRAGMESAVSMAAGGSLKSGAGLVSCAVSESVARSMQKVSLSTINFLLAGTLDGALAESSVKKILEYADKRKVDALALGPGMGTSKSTAGLVNNLIKKFKHPMIIDADALNCISSNTDILKKREKGMTVITPHPGEMQRLCGRKKEGILEDPVSVAEEFARKYSVVVVLKGYRSIVSDGKRTFINSTGSPGMAVGGSGDILSGIIATLMAQGFNPLEAAKTGVWVHGRAGDIAVWNRSERASLPEDFLAEMERV